MHANRFLWARLMDILLSLPTPPPFVNSPSPLAFSRPASHPPPPRLERIHIAFGNPRWTALAEVPYVLGVVRALDWDPMDELVGRHWPQPISTKAGSAAVATPRLELSIAARPTSRAQVERAVLGHVSMRVQRVLEFVRGA